MRHFLQIAGSVVTALVVVVALSVGAWFVYSAATGATLVVFRTGSMAPAIPQGSLAVAVPVAAAEVEVGDVVTIERGGQLPITHRVIEIKPGDSAQSRELTLQGDANASPDRAPYIVSEVRRVQVSVPGAGTVLAVLRTPLGLGAMTLLAGGLAVWAFWPRAQRDEEER